MRHFQLNKNIPTPLYYQLKQHIMSEIEAGHLKPGDILPSERELSSRFGISKMTVRQALKELVNEGKLVREQGRGTFISEAKINQGLLKLTGFSEDMRNRGMDPSALVLDQNVIVADEKMARHLSLSEGDPIFQLRRVRYADGRPMAIEQSHISVGRFPNIEKQDFANVSLYNWLEKNYPVQINYAEQTIEVRLPDPEEAEILHISRSAPVLLINRTTFDFSNQPIEYVVSIYRGDRYKLFVDLKR